MQSFDDVFSYGSVLLYGHKEKHLYKAVYEACLNAPVEGVVWVCYKHPPDAVRTLQSRYGSKIYGLTDNILFIDMISGEADGKGDVVHCSNPTDYDCLFRSIYTAIGEFGRCVVVFDDLKEAMAHSMFGRFAKLLKGMNSDIQRMECAAVYLATSGAFDMQTAEMLKTSLNAVIELEDVQETSPENVFDASWDDLKRITWRDVFSLNVPALYLMLVATCCANIVLAIILALVLLGK